MLTLTLEPELERRIIERARHRGVTESDLVRELIEASLDDLDDIQMAVERLEHAQKPLTGAAVHKALGLDD